VSTGAEALVAFVLARLDHAERLALAVKPLGAAHEEGEVPRFDSFFHGRFSRDTGQAWYEPADVEFFASQDPQRVLEDLAAKRRLVELYAEARRNAIDYREDYTLAGDRPWSVKADSLELAVQVIALPWAHHPDYQESWRP
jgi:hypothetical protein